MEARIRGRSFRCKPLAEAAPVARGAELPLELRRRQARLLLHALRGGPAPAPPATVALGPPASAPSRPASRPPSRPASRSLQMGFEQRQAAVARRARIQELQQGLIDHDEERLGGIAAGTSPLTGARGQPMLPVPPLDVDPLRLPLELRLRLAVSNKIFKSFRRPWLMALHAEPGEVPLRQAVVEAVETQGFDAITPRESFIPQSDYALPMGDASPQELLLRAEEVFVEALEDRCLALAWRFLGASHEASVQEVLHMLRLLSHLREQNFTAASKKDVELIMVEVLHSLTGRLKDLDDDVLHEISEVAGIGGVGEEAFTALVQQSRAQRSAKGS